MCLWMNKCLFIFIFLLLPFLIPTLNPFLFFQFISSPFRDVAHVSWRRCLLSIRWPVSLSVVSYDIKKDNNFLPDATIHILVYSYLPQFWRRSHYFLSSPDKPRWLNTRHNVSRNKDTIGSYTQVVSYKQSMLV